MTSFLRREDTQEAGHEKTGRYGSVADKPRNAKDCRQPPKDGRSNEQIPPPASGGSVALLTP